jgi:hypothetical protein
MTIAWRYPVEEIDGVLATWEGTQNMDPKTMVKKPGAPNRFSVLNGTGPAVVRVGIEEKVSGPTGTYSSVSVRVEVSAHCDQSEASIQRAHQLLFDEGTRALDGYMDTALELLNRHLQRHGNA